MQATRTVLVTKTARPLTCAHCTFVFSRTRRNSLVQWSDTKNEDNDDLLFSLRSANEEITREQIGQRRTGGMPQLHRKQPDSLGTHWTVSHGSVSQDVMIAIIYQLSILPFPKYSHQIYHAQKSQATNTRYYKNIQTFRNLPSASTNLRRCCGLPEVPGLPFGRLSPNPPVACPVPKRPVLGNPCIFRPGAWGPPGGIWKEQ